MSKAVLYKFKSLDTPWGEVWVAAQFEGKPDGEELLTKFPERYMKEHPECTELLSSDGVRFERVVVK